MKQACGMVAGVEWGAYKLGFLLNTLKQIKSN